MQRVNSEPWLSRHVWVGVISEHSGPPFSNLFPVCFTLFGQKNYLNKRLWFMCTRAHYKSRWGKKTEEKERERTSKKRSDFVLREYESEVSPRPFILESQQIDVAKKYIGKLTLWPSHYELHSEKRVRNIVLSKLRPSCKRWKYLATRRARLNKELSTIIFSFAVY